MIVEKIKALCDQKGVTVKEVERACEFGNGTIRRWDESSPSIDKAAKVAAYFGITVDELVKEA